MNATLVLPETLALDLREAASGELETAGVLLASVFQTSDGNLRVLGRHLRWVPYEAYRVRDSDQLEISSDGYVDSLAEAEAIGALAIWFHTHPREGSSPESSVRDDRVDELLSDVFRLRSGQDFYGALIVAIRDGNLSFTGHLDDGNNRFRIERLWSVGDRLVQIVASNSVVDKPGPTFDRNVRAFGGSVQQVLQELRVGIVGCGGTGSSVAEQLVRLGVRNFHLIDPDLLAESNLTRLYGSTPADIGRRKVEVLAGHLQAVAPDAVVTTDTSSIIFRLSALGLAGSDVIFGCTDDNAGRLVLSRLSTYLLTPVIDCGVLLSSDTRADGRLSGIDGRVTTLVPGAGCLVCRGRVDLQRANSELLTADERNRLIGEGYAPALQGIEPAVVAFTTLVAATAVSELLERLIGYGPDPRPTEVLLRIHDREVSTNVMTPRPQHYCDPDTGKLGAGITEPFLEQTWP